jgi:hypothetical protein
MNNFMLRILYLWNIPDTEIFFQHNECLFCGWSAECVLQSSCHILRMKMGLVQFHDGSLYVSGVTFET